MNSTPTRSKCDMCAGTGRVHYWRANCPNCHGCGYVFADQCRCPQCGSGIMGYGGGWACVGLYCCHSPSGIVVSNPPEPDWWSDGTMVYLDGNAWCAVNADFQNLQESPAGFGETPRAAVAELRRAT